MGASPLAPADLSDIAGVYAPSGASTPLWYYILAEARIAAGGVNLGPVGGRIVTETLISLLRADPSSYLNLYPGSSHSSVLTSCSGRRPTPPFPATGPIPRAHFLHYAGVADPGTYR